VIVEMFRPNGEPPRIDVRGADAVVEQHQRTPPRRGRDTSPDIAQAGSHEAARFTARIATVTG
jgi:hypothetical protein